MGPDKDAQFRIAGTTVMALLSLCTIAVLLAVPKSGGDAATWVALGQVAAGLAIARAILLLRGDYFGVKLIPRGSRFLYAVVGLFIFVAVTVPFFELRVASAYIPAFAGILVGNLFTEEPQQPANAATRIPAQGALIVAAAFLSLAAIGATVWTVVTVQAGAGSLVNALILAGTLLWMCGLLAIFRLDGLLWAPRRAQARRSADLGTEP